MTDSATNGTIDGEEGSVQIRTGAVGEGDQISISLYPEDGQETGFIQFEANRFRFVSAGDAHGGYVDVVASKPPTSPPRGEGRIFMTTNKRGKGQLVIQFHTGPPQVIAQEP